MRDLSLLYLLVLLASCGSNLIKKSPEELRMEIKAQEQSSSTDYLVIEGGTILTPGRVNEAGGLRDLEYDGYYVQGIIRNTATIAKFRDVVLTVQLYSQADTVFEEQDYMIHEFLDPGSFSVFSIQVDAPKVTEEYKVRIKSAATAD